MHALVIPLYTRTEYLEQVSIGLRVCCNKESFKLYFALDSNTPDTFREYDWGISYEVVKGVDQNVNLSIIEGFNKAFQDGALTVTYLADDCVPSVDLLRMIDWLSNKVRLFGFWCPAHNEAVNYPELILPVRGKCWPSKCWGCNKDIWPVISSYLKSNRGVYDTILAEAMVIENWVVYIPLCPRVKDIGRIGCYDTVEVWDKYFSWIVSANPYTGIYILPWSP